MLTAAFCNLQFTKFAYIRIRNASHKNSKLSYTRNHNMFLRGKKSDGWQKSNNFQTLSIKSFFCLVKYKFCRYNFKHRIFYDNLKSTNTGKSRSYAKNYNSIKPCNTTITQYISTTTYRDFCTTNNGNTNKSCRNKVKNLQIF